MKTLVPFLLILVIVASCTKTKENTASSFDQQLEDYLIKFPYQDTYDYLMKYTGGDPSHFNKLTTVNKPVLVQAGEDKIVRMNNDTYYSGGFIYLSQGPVKLSSYFVDETRFYSFQLMDDKNCNFHNIIRPEGDYFLYYGEEPDNLEGQLIESPSLLVGVIIRVEVKDKDDPSDVALANKAYAGLDISGPEITEFPQVDLLSDFDDAVAIRAHEMMDSVFANVPFRGLVAAPDQVPDEVSYLHLAAGTKGGWGGPVAEHSTYQMIFFDKDGEPLDGSKGTYILTTEEPDVNAFWSVTAYDTERGGFFHPNKDNRYHINNTTAVRNDDGTITFTFKTSCEDGDVNCLQVPAGKFDLTARYYLPKQKLIDGEWTMPLPELYEE